MMSVLVTALCNQPEASNLGDDQSHYLFVNTVAIPEVSMRR